MKKSTKKHMKWWQVVIYIVAVPLCVFAVALSLFLMILQLPGKSAHDDAIKGFVIPELDDGFVPQGLEYDDMIDRFFVTGYMNDHSASPIYIVNSNDSTFSKIVLADQDGEPMNGHAGGITITDDNAFVCDGEHGGLYVYDKTEIVTAPSGSQVKAIGFFSTKYSKDDYLGPAFTTIDENGNLCVGEFYRAGNYETLMSHRMTTNAGDENTAQMWVFAPSNEEGSQFGFETTPSYIYSMRGLVQGAAFYEGKIYLSTSYGLASSEIFAYDGDLRKMSTQTVEINGQNTTVYELDSSVLVGSEKLVPMSEEIAFLDGRMYVMCESASDKYIFGKISGGKWCYAYQLDF